MIKSKLSFTILFIQIVCLGWSHRAQSQDIHFSQFFETPLLRNPALAGLFDGDIRIQGVYRDQWNSFTNAYRTGSFNMEYKKPFGKRDDYITLGLQVAYDKAGTVALTTTQLLPVLNYHKSLNENRNMYLSLGFMGGLVQKGIDRSKVTTNSQYDGMAYNPGLADGEYFTDFKQSYWDGGFGLSFNSNIGENPGNLLFVGAAYHHFNRPLNSFYKNATIGLQPKWVYSAGLKLQINEYSFFNIQADHSVQATSSETLAGALYGHRLGDFPDDAPYTVYVGAFLRWKDALIPVVKMDFRPMSLAISYDVNISTLKTASMGRGGVEISLSYIGFLDRYNSTRDAVRCPKF